MNVRQTSPQGMCLPLIGILLFFTLMVSAADWVQMRGPDNTGASAERILQTWPEEGLKEVWRAPLNNGFSTFSVAANRVYTQVTRETNGVDKEYCVALDAATGTELWGVPLDVAVYESGAGSGDGPRSTPTVDGDRVYVLTSYLKLYCLEAESGKVVWKVDFMGAYGASGISWQSAASPVVEGNKVIVNGNASGNTVFGLNKTNGAVLWRTQTEKSTHSTPVMATIEEVRQIIFLTKSGLLALNPEDGSRLWRYSFSYNTSTAASPVVGSNMVFCSAGYGVGAAGVRITKSNEVFVVKELWRNKTGKIQNHWSTPVYHEGFLYGIFGYPNSGSNPLKCLNMETGQEMWSAPYFGPGGVILVDHHLVVMAENGSLVLVEATPAQYTEVARFQPLSDKCWNNVAFSNGRIYARSIQEGVCLDATPPPLPTPLPLKLYSVADPALGRVQLSIANEDGSGVSQERMSRISVQVSTNLNMGWETAASGLVYSNGTLCFEQDNALQYSQRYYRVIETQ